MENLIAELLFRIPFDYFKEYIDLYFQGETKIDLEKNKVNSYISLIEYYNRRL